MKKIALSKMFVVGILACAFVSCSKNTNQFTIEGDIQDAGDKTLYLENIGTSAITLLDSVKLPQNGSFRFKQPRPETPDFYRLRLDHQLINIAIDSTETITIHGNVADFAKNYTVEGSVDCEQIKVLTLLQLNAYLEYNQLEKRHTANEISEGEYLEQVNKIVEDYKTVARKYIYANPISTTAYFALYQQINKMLIFDPYDKNDSKAFGAVANSWYVHYPQSLRATQLYNLFSNSLAYLRGNKEHPVTLTEGDSQKLFDISLPSISGKFFTLSEIGKGKVILIDFTSYGTKESPARNILLAELYEKYKSKGFEIYQISLDTDEHFWKNASVNLPWICVWDQQSVNSDILKKYNVSEIPTSFIRDREGELVSRIESYNQLEKDIASVIGH